MIKTRDVIEIKVVTTIPSILDYDAYICNSRKQKMRWYNQDQYTPNCLMLETAVNILEDLGYKKIDKRDYMLNNDDIFSTVRIVPAKVDEYSVSKDPNTGALIYGEHWKDYPNPYLFKVMNYKRRYRLATTTAQELNEMKNCICKTYMNVLGKCTDLKTEICPLCEVYTASDMSSPDDYVHNYRCGYLPKEFNTEEEYMEYYDDLIYNIYNGAYRLGIIDDVGRIHHENIQQVDYDMLAKTVMNQFKSTKKFANS